MGAEVSFVGSHDGQEATLVPDAGYRFHPVHATPLRREFSLRSAKAPFVALGSVRRCLPWVRPADVVVGVGGYASVPAVLAARWAKRPIALHEQNAVASLANRKLARFARAAGVSFEAARVSLGAAVPTEMTGNPVRSSILAVPANREALAAKARETFGFEAGRTTIGVFGGSLGALSLDEALATALGLLRDRDDLQVLALTGRGHLGVVTDAVDGTWPLRVRAVPFLERMDLAYAITDLAVSRAGAGHLAELAVCGIPSILIPYPHATEDHQTANARELQGVGAAEIVTAAALTGAVMAARVERLVADAPGRGTMAAAARRWGRPDADLRLAEMVARVAGERATDRPPVDEEGRDQ
jgi:UDP-N-acetylglucosamine--N-acetylmuramyl-(pentapeptide) pyrophosphoryl-undecaprenol N-acetylglucosamine transferase